MFVILVCHSVSVFSQNDSEKVQVDTVEFAGNLFEVIVEEHVKPTIPTSTNVLITSDGDTIGSLSPGSMVGCNLYDYGRLQLINDTITVLGYQKAMLSKDDSVIILYLNGSRSTNFACFDLDGEMLFSERVASGLMGGNGVYFERTDGIYTWGRPLNCLESSFVRKFTFAGELVWEISLDNNYPFVRAGFPSPSLDLLSVIQYKDPTDYNNRPQLIVDTKTGVVVSTFNADPYSIALPIDANRIVIRSNRYDLEVRSLNNRKLIKSIKGTDNYWYGRSVGFCKNSETLFRLCSSFESTGLEFIDLETKDKFFYRCQISNIGRWNAQRLDKRTVVFRTYSPSQGRISIRLLE